MPKVAKDVQLGKHNVKKIGHRVVGRIRDDAVTRVIYEEEKRIEKIFEEAQRLAQHAGRETVTEDDVRLAIYYMDES